MLATFAITGTVLFATLFLLLLAHHWDTVNLFFHAHYTYFNLLFSTLYFIEQAVFVMASYAYPVHINFFVGFFALLVLSTVALQGVMMESKNKKVNEKLAEYLRSSTIRLADMRKTYESRISSLRILLEKAKHNSSVTR